MIRILWWKVEASWNLYVQYRQPCVFHHNLHNKAFYLLTLINFNIWVLDALGPRSVLCPIRGKLSIITLSGHAFIDVLACAHRWYTNVSPSVHTIWLLHRSRFAISKSILSMNLSSLRPVHSTQPYLAIIIGTHYCNGLGYKSSSVPFQYSTVRIATFTISHLDICKYPYPRWHPLIYASKSSFVSVLDHPS